MKTGEMLRAFFDEQLACWPMARGHYDDLQRVVTKYFDVEGNEIDVQFNPGRIVSTGADISREKIGKRPCFLCSENRPAVQSGMKITADLELLVNPFPILPVHFTIAECRHVPQRIRDHYMDMVRLADGVSGMFVFYNGPKCGASAPDHMHLQMGVRGLVPLERLWSERFAKSCESGMFMLQNYIVPAFAIVTDTAEDNARLFQRLYDVLPKSEEEGEPMMNILAWTEDATGSRKLVSVVIPRAKHRPSCYYAEDESRLLVSPGALDMAGLVITPREEDFKKISAADVVGILREVALSEEEAKKIFMRL